jgi:caa(3)-type oxidase subunit IV
MTSTVRRLLLSWLLLMVLAGAEFGASFLPLGRSERPLVLVPAVLMIAGVATLFMHVRRGPTIVRLFAVAALLWLTILLGLGTLDPMTRTDLPVETNDQR